MTEEQEGKFSGLVSKLGLSPLEATQIISKKSGNITIGIPKERAFQEHRVPLTPDAVQLLTSYGHHVIIESGAGDLSYFGDRLYTEAGAELEYSTKEVYAKSDVVLKITPPTVEETELMRMNQVIFSPVHLPTFKGKCLKKMISKKITALAYDYIQDDWGVFPIVRSMSEIAGNTVVHIAAEYLSNLRHGRGILMGGITGVPPARVVILGAGIVAENAVKAAIGMGAMVKVFDNSMYKLRRLQDHVGRRIYTSVINPNVLIEELSKADVAIGAMHSKTGRTPVVVSEYMVRKMKAGAVIIDVSIDQGGCFETSEVTNQENPTFVKHDVIHYCVPNIASRVSRTASEAVSNILTPILGECMETGGIKNLLIVHKGLRKGAYLYNGFLTNQHFSDLYEIKYTDLEMILASGL